MSWYYAIAGQQKGPFSDEDFERLVGNGTVQADTLVWKEGWPEWRAYSAVAAGSTGTSNVEPDTAVCAVSGRRLPKRDMLEFEGRWVSAEHKDEFFQRLREGVSLPRDVEYAGFWPRVGAKIIDGIILFVGNAIISGVIAGATIGTSGGNSTAIVLAQVLIQVINLTFSLGYVIYFIRKFDATPGKLALGLRLLRADGSKLSKGRIVGRYFAEFISSMILLIGYLMVAFDKEERRALHDRIVDTRVIVHRR